MYPIEVHCDLDHTVHLTRGNTDVTDKIKNDSLKPGIHLEHMEGI